MTQSQKMLMWAILAALAALMTYLSFRAYLGAEFLISFANSLYC
jgi:riboflavin transporter FmnP